MKRPAVRLLTLSLPFAFCLAAAALYAPAAPRPSSRATNAQDAARPADEMDAEEYAVLSAVLGAGGPFLIKDETEHWQDVAGGREGFNAELKQSSKELLDETIEDYWAKNRNPHKLAARFDTKMRYTFISAEYLDNLFKAKGPLAGWEEFYKKYPKYGFVTFSRVGFSADKTQALVYHSYGCGPMCGGGGYLLLVKKGGVWIEKGSVGSSWVS